ncbi:aminoglycoside 6'-acetyltransferase [Devosia limi DSM 17137]|uniref:Aminoglycoside N(6')-acetyltransferase type 1 n=1 Tax=Devosia limi DSM 17137 TaxID=1121477 RepID=A0A0F5LS10_9HYPH|nr:aminoglycoside 6'-acetyltransferase [Devosia limi DSM 17137]SHF39223.1 aminoglycoside 6'-N-acetyltransferase I [Devosia limi DSM 17137]
MIVAPATAADLADWADLRQALWPDDGLDGHRAEIAGMLAAPDLANFIARTEDGLAAGLAEASLRRDYVNGCETSPVAFLEGIYVMPEYRRSGIASQLVAAVEDWARTRGCSEFASDASLDNLRSHAMHAALGFEETQRVVYFRKVLD